MQDSFKHKGMRIKLIEQIREKGIVDEQVLQAIEKLPRHFFLESAFLEHAYQDKAFSIGEGQTISQPSTVAFQTELLNLTEGEKVLEIGTGSGYQACILLELGAKLTTIEINKTLFEKSKKMIADLGYKRCRNILGDGSQGYPTIAPYDKILVTAGSPKIPKNLVEQLKTGGIMVIPVGDRFSQEMLRITKTADKGEVEIETFDNFRFVPLIGKFGWQDQNL
ncbi:MAG: protein-L-isoaspartate(D-aspartate) O-methyltransferase [Bacteroidetes bacterium]|nr:MAG: protein-L-isoaspartate(D-aspartate) O-methyltransferase [Bacteroidota bacterium]